MCVLENAKDDYCFEKDKSRKDPVTDDYYPVSTYIEQSCVQVVRKY